MPRCYVAYARCTAHCAFATFATTFLPVPMTIPTLHAAVGYTRFCYAFKVGLLGWVTLRALHMPRLVTIPVVLLRVRCLRVYRLR